MDGLEVLDAVASVDHFPMADMRSKEFAAPRHGRTTRFLIIEAQALVRHWLALALKAGYPGACCQEAATVDEAIWLADRLLVPNLIVLDVDGLDGPSDVAVRKVGQHFPGVPLIVTCSSPDVPSARACLVAGACTVVLKTEPTSVLDQAVAFALTARGYRLLPGWVGYQAGMPAAELEGEGVLDRLTPRQRQILALLQNGASNKEIARHLGLLEGTVKVHIRAMMQKLGVANRTQIALMAARAAGRLA